MSSEKLKKLLPMFRETTADRVEKISSVLLALERGAASDEQRQELARELHTLKGESRMMGFTGISAVVHAAEELLKACGTAPARPQAQGLLETCDAVLLMLDQPAELGPAAEALVARLYGLAGLPPPAPTTPAAPAPARPATPAAPSAPAGGLRPAARLELKGDAAQASIRVDIDRLDEIAAIAGDVLVEGARANRRARDLEGLFARWNRISDRVVALAERLRHEGSGDRFSEQLEGDVHLLRSDTFRFARIHSEAVQGARAQFTRLAERVGSARLIPLSGVLAGFPRAAREMAREQGKELDCEVSGGETGVDKAILLSLNDPLVHLVRNSIDHGVETPAERTAAGKPPVARLAITARSDGDLLALVVEDDGRGIDPQRIRATALERGVVGEQQAASLSARAALELIFLPGFSTRASAGETSGRGVGLDVVRRKVTALGGSVTVESEPGRWTRFTLRMPQSLSLMKVLLVRVDEDVYGLPAIDVDGVGRLDPASVSDVAGIRAVRYRDRLLPLVALGPLLSLNGGPRHPRPTVAYVLHGDEGAAVVVDGLSGEREVAVKAPGAFLKGMRFVTGAAALEDGRVALLLSTPDVISAARRLASPAALHARDRRRLRILLVDDSAIAREAEAVLLRSLGHEVDEAVDGEDGWQRLQGGAYQLLITDVQMPVLDGIDLTRRVKGSPRFHKLPILILSSLSAPEERRRGVDAGADAYMVKGEMDAETLASAMERLCGVGG